MHRKKIRELGLSLGVLPTGEKNCITDVKGIHVGHKTLHFPLENGEYSCTGVTAILQSFLTIHPRLYIGGDELSIFPNPFML